MSRQRPQSAPLLGRTPPLNLANPVGPDTRPPSAGGSEFDNPILKSIEGNLVGIKGGIENLLGALQSGPSLSNAIKVPQPAESLISSRHKWIIGGLGALSGASILTIAGLARAFENVKGERDAAEKDVLAEKKKKPVPLVGEWPLDKRETFLVLGGLALVLLGLAFLSSRPVTISAPPPMMPPRF